MFKNIYTIYKENKFIKKDKIETAKTWKKVFFLKFFIIYVKMYNVCKWGIVTCLWYF